MSRCRAVLTVALAAGVLPSIAAAQTAVEQVGYSNATDATALGASLSLPAGDGPHPAVVVLSIAGTGPLVDRLVAGGYAVLQPVRRGFVDVEPMLAATYDDLAADVAAALAYLESRGDIDAGRVGVIAQADDAPPAILAAAASEAVVPLVLLAPPAFSGVEMFRMEQRWLAERDGARPDELVALDDYVGRIAEIALEATTPSVREHRLQSLRAGSAVQLPRNAAIPADALQAHFFASPLWHDRLAFEPEAALARVHTSVLALIGMDDPNTPLEAYLAALRRGLAGAPTHDTTVCLLPGRTRHAFTDESLDAIGTWLAARMDGSADPIVEPEALGCLDESVIGPGRRR